MHQKMLDHLTFSLDLPSCDFHAPGSLEKVPKGCKFMSDGNGEVIPAAAQAALCEWGRSTGWCKNGMPVTTSMGQFSMATIPSPRTIRELVSSKKASYIHTGHHFILNLLNLEM
jgi:hypothetical protein